jgi:hypothetical protein
MIFPMKTSALIPILAGVGALGAVLLAGCGSAGGPRDLMLEEAQSGAVERPVAMKGEAAFLEGKLTALATISRGFDRGVPGGRSGGRGGRGNDERRGRRDDSGAFGETYNVAGDSDEEQKEAIEEYIRQAKARRAAGSPMPPVTLRVEFENRTSLPMEIEVTEVNSELGNFAVRPPKLTLAPGAKGSLDPMVSQLGVTSDEIPLKVAVRTGGHKESQVIAVKNALAPAVQKQIEAAQKAPK